jgi:hypothetical protein
MSFSHSIRRLAAASLVVACAAVLVAVAPGNAQPPGKTITITTGPERFAMLDVAPKGLARGRVSLGDQVFVSAPARTDGGARGSLTGVFTVGNPHSVRIARARGLLSGVYHLADGDIHIQAAATFDDSDEDHGAVVGGTGAYAGARGTVDSNAHGDVIRLMG